MKVLFVSSGNSGHFKISPFVDSQGKSIEQLGVSVEYFSLEGKGIRGYLNNIFLLRKYLKKNNFDLIHAHYTLSAWPVVLAMPKKPIVLSLMGSDAYGDYIGVNKISFKSRYLILLTYLIQPFVNAIVCKSKHIQTYVYLKKKSFVVPNGIQLKTIPSAEIVTKEALGLSSFKKHVLFLGSKIDVRKNYTSVEKAVRILNNDQVELITPYPTTHETALKYMQVVDVIVVPSLMEGSPNVVKEAMASNCPVVATNVGDVKWLFGNEPGYFLTGFDVNEIAKNIELALEYSANFGRTNGKKRIIELQLQAEDVAKKIISIYEKTRS